MGREHTYAVTLIKAGVGIPLVEVGAYRYTADWLPQVGDTIPIRPASSSEEGASELQGYVTRVNPVSDAPISVVEVEGGERSVDDVVVQPIDRVDSY
jgi:hypothetical protein